MSFRNKGLVLAMEEEAIIAAPEGEMDPALPAEVEAGAAEVTEQVGEVEDLNTAIEEAEADAETLGDIQETLAETVESGEGVDETTAEVAEIAVEAICARLGIRNAQKVVPSLESFGSKSSRVTATRVAVESIGDKIKQIWSAIMAAIKTVWEKVKSFVAGLLKNRGMLEKHLEGLKKRVETLDGNLKPKEKEVSGGAGKAFGIGGKADLKTAETVLENARKLMGVASVAVQQASRTAGQVLNFEKDPSGATKAKGELVGAVSEAVKKLGEVSSKDGVSQYGQLVGGKTIVVNAQANAEKQTLDIQIGELSKEQPKTAAALSRDEMKSLVGEALDLVKALKEYDKVEKDLAKISAECAKVVDAVLKGAANRMEDKEAAEAVRKGAADVRELNSMIGKFGASIPSVIFMSAKAAGDYVSASLANHGAEKKEEAKKE